MTNASRLRLVVLSALVLSLVATLLGRLWYLQVMAAPTYRTVAANNQIRDIVTQAPRGEIVDDTGRPLVQNKTALVVSIDRLKLLAQPDSGNAVLGRLSKLLHISVSGLQHKIRLCGTETVDGRTVIIRRPCWAGSSYQPIPVDQLKTTPADERTAIQIDELSNEFPAVTVQPAAVLSYPKPQGALASAMLGYVSPITQQQLDKLPASQRPIEQSTQVGATGLEQSYEKFLHGTPGLKQVTVDHLGGVTSTIRDTAPVTGDTVVTNIDAKVQSGLEKQLHAALLASRSSGHTADYGAGVVLNTRTGGVVGMASEPTYQPDKAPNTLTQKQYKKLLHAPGSPLYDKAFESAQAPGSTFKLVSSLGLIKDGTASIYGAYDCPSSFRGRHNFEGESGKGSISFHEAIVISCDTFFFNLANEDYNRDQTLIAQHKKPREGVQAMAHALGIGVPVGVDLPNATEGHIADRYNTKYAWEHGGRANYCAGAKTRPQGSYDQKLDAQDCKYGYEFFPGDQWNEDLGQGTVAASPLQMAVAYAAVANGGTVFEPRVAKAIVSPTGKVIKRIQAPIRGHIPVTQQVISYLRDAFYGVINEHDGTGYSTYHVGGFPLSKVAVGGKTGTAELPHTSQDGSWFASFAGPAGQKPQFVTVIYVHKGDQGAITAAPSTKVMWDEIYGLQGDKGDFPNGVPPGPLPASVLHPNRALHAPAGPKTTTSPSPGQSSRPSSTSSPSVNAAGLPPALAVRFGARAGSRAS